MRVVCRDPPRSRKAQASRPRPTGSSFGCAPRRRRAGRTGGSQGRGAALGLPFSAVTLRGADAPGEGLRAGRDDGNNKHSTSPGLSATGQEALGMADASTCYPSHPMPQPSHAKELEDLRARLWESKRTSRRSSPRSRGVFAATQSDMSGDVGLDDEPRTPGPRRSSGGERSLDRKKHPRSLRKDRRSLKRMDAVDYWAVRALRQADREGSRSRRCPTRSSAQARAGGALASRLDPVDARRSRAALTLFVTALLTTGWTDHEDLGGVDTPGRPIDFVPLCSRSVHHEIGRRFQYRQKTPWFFVGVTAVVVVIILATSFPPTRARSGASLGMVRAERSGNLTDRAVRGRAWGARRGFRECHVGLSSTWPNLRS